MPAPKVCRACGSKHVARSSRRSLFEKLISFLGILPYRCQDCLDRFFVWIK
jgi:hypothetical protein